MYGPLTCDFVLQASTQDQASAAEAQTRESPPAVDGGDKGGEGGGGGGGRGCGVDEEESGADGGRGRVALADESSSECEDDSHGPKRKRRLPPGSNGQAHSVAKRCMPLWMRDAIGPAMAESPSDSDRFSLVLDALSRYKMKVDDVEDLNFKKRMKDCASNADKVRIALL